MMRGIDWEWVRNELAIVIGWIGVAVLGCGLIMLFYLALMNG